MRSAVIAIIVFVSTSLSAQVAQACRVMRSPEQRIEDGYRTHPDLKVAFVRIGAARHLSNDMIRKLHNLYRDYESPWRATASVTKVVIGQGSPELIVFDRNWGSAACDDGTPMPSRGDPWVVYYTSDHLIDAATVLESYPLAAALKADPRLRRNGS